MVQLTISIGMFNRYVRHLPEGKPCLNHGATSIFPVKPPFSSVIFQPAMFDYQRGGIPCQIFRHLEFLVFCVASVAIFGLLVYHIGVNGHFQ